MRSLQESPKRTPTSLDFLSRFDSFFNDFEKDFFSGEKSLTKGANSFNPLVDIEETDKAYIISADLPGVKKEDAKIDVQNRTLRIAGERSRESGDESGNYYERSYGKFVRSFHLPETVDEKNIEAHFEDGVLRVLLPKTEVQTPQEVKIQSGKPQDLKANMSPKN